MSENRRDKNATEHSGPQVDLQCGSCCEEWLGGVSVLEYTACSWPTSKIRTMTRGDSSNNCASWQKKNLVYAEGDVWT